MYRWTVVAAHLGGCHIGSYSRYYFEAPHAEAAIDHAEHLYATENGFDVDDVFAEIIDIDEDDEEDTAEAYVY